jgi:hypothetical protein
MAYRTVVFAQDMVIGWSWIAFAILGNGAGLIETLEAQFPPSLGIWFELSMFIAGVLILIAIGKNKLFVPAFVFSSFVAISAFFASLTVAGDSALYPAVWAMMAFVSITQAIRRAKGWDSDGT